MWLGLQPDEDNKREYFKLMLQFFSLRFQESVAVAHGSDNKAITKKIDYKRE